MLARELHETSELLSQVLESLQGSSVQQLPVEDKRIGAYVYDALERSKGVGAVYAHLEANYSVRPLHMAAHAGAGVVWERPPATPILLPPAMLQIVADMLCTCLELCMAAARLLEHNACQLLDPRLMSLLLGPDRSIPRTVKRAALGLVFTVSFRTVSLVSLLLVCASRTTDPADCMQALSLASQTHEPDHSTELSVDETNQRREQRVQLCQASSAGGVQAQHGQVC